MDNITAWRKRKLNRLGKRLSRMDSKDSAKIESEIKRLRKSIRNAERMDAEGGWRTTETGNHIYVNGSGEVTKGNPKVVKALNDKKKTRSTSKEAYRRNPANHVKSAVSASKDHTLGDGFSKEAQDVYDKMRSNEAKITADVGDIADEIGGEMTGLEFSVKTASSVADKVARKKEKNPDASDAELIAQMGDIVRYTVLGKHDELVDITEKAIDAFEEKGYHVFEVENKYLDADSDYKGIHLGIKSPDGQVFEYQVHSKESMDVKNKLHPIYEESRKVTTSKEDRARMQKEMKEISKSLPMPKGIERLQNRKEKK